ncbi:hypothetical protein J0H58_09390 [bacterium]|nr:hypothetical protein [bacterium]
MPAAAPQTLPLPRRPAPGRHAAGIGAGDRTHWAGVGHTPDGADPVHEFPAHIPGPRQLATWLQRCGVTTVALEAAGAYAHVLFLIHSGSGWRW